MNVTGVFAVSVSALLLAGCSSGLLGGGGSAPNAAEARIPVNNELAMPPDLSLRQPGSGVPAYQAPAAAQQVDDGIYNDNAAPPPVRAAAPTPAQSAYDKYGISTVKADGTKKKDWELREELRQAIIAEKRKKNPNYGTVFNAGKLFSDE